MLQCAISCGGVIREELGVHIVEDGGKDCVGHDGNRDGDRQGPGFYKVSASINFFARLISSKPFTCQKISHL